MRLCKEWKVALCAITTAAVVACGGGGGAGAGAGAGGDGIAPAAALSTSGATIARDQEIVIRFTESMNPASLELSGAMAAEAVGTWSRTAAPNDTYTLRPADGAWSVGVWLDLVATASDASGEPLAAPVSAKHLVPLHFWSSDAASVVIGQADFGGSLPNRGAGPDGNTLNIPYGGVAVAPDGKLFVPDYGNGRVVAFGSVPATNDTAAAYALGTPDLTTPGTGAPGQASLGSAQSLSIAQGRMAVTDYINHRVLIYDRIPGAGDLPTTVVGQATFASNGSACTSNGLDHPEGATLTPSGKLIVTDSGNNRVLIWNTVPSVNGQPADLVLGQERFTNCAARDSDQNGTPEPTPTARTMNYPAGVWSDGTRLVVVDTGNSRVLIWNTFPVNNFQPADLVLGQSDFKHAAANDDGQTGGTGATPTGRTLNAPFLGVASNGVQLAIADTSNSRVLIWNTFPVSDFQPADVVLGQPDFTSNVVWGTTWRSLNVPTGLNFSGDKLLVTDSANSRVLVFHSQSR